MGRNNGSIIYGTLNNITISPPFARAEYGCYIFRLYVKSMCSVGCHGNCGFHGNFFFRQTLATLRPTPTTRRRSTSLALVLLSSARSCLWFSFFLLLVFALTLILFWTGFVAFFCFGPFFDFYLNFLFIRFFLNFPHLVYLPFNIFLMLL